MCCFIKLNVPFCFSFVVEVYWNWCVAGISLLQNNGFKSLPFEIYCAKRSDFTKKKKKKKKRTTTSLGVFQFKIFKIRQSIVELFKHLSRIVHASKRPKIPLNETIRTTERVISWLWSGLYMFASNITASSRFHGSVPYAEACARW